MPRIVIDYVKCDGFRKAINVKINGIICGTIQPLNTYDESIFSGENELVILCGQSSCEPINFAIEDRETVRFTCSVSGGLSKKINVTKLYQKSPTKRFNNIQTNSYIDADSQYDMAKNWRSILGVDENASMDEIRRTYIDLMKTYHPDKIFALNPQSKINAEARAIEINKAYTFAKRFLKI